MECGTIRAAMVSTTTSPRHASRQFLRSILPTDSDFSAFCIDFFPAVAERFSNSMDRVAKTSLLLELVDTQALVSALKQHDPQRLIRYERRYTATARVQGNPYRGLSAFNLDEAHLFFGREALTAQLWQRVEAMHEQPDATGLIAILGPSGSGKSSVARAGLLAALVRAPVPGPQPMRIAILKPGERPIENLARAMVPLLPASDGLLPAERAISIERLLRHREAPCEGLRRFVADLPNLVQCPVLVLVDQFEEVYTQCRDVAERDLFVGLLLHAAQARDGHASVVLTLRSDFLGETQRHHNLLSRLIAEQAVIVPPLSPEELRDAIAKPAEQAGRPIDQATIELLLSQMRVSQAALPLLEFALTRIWEGMERGEEASATLCQLGGLGGALAGEAQKIYKSLSEQDRATASRALVRLVRLGEGARDTRRRVPLPELCGRGETETAVLSVLRQFATETARLITLDGQGADTAAEVTHEALFDHWSELRMWIEQGRQDRMLYDRALEAAKLWRQAGCPAGRLWRRPDLDLLRDYQRRKPEEFGTLLTAFLAAAHRRQRIEWRVSLGAIAAVVASLLAAAGVYVSKEQQRTSEAFGAKERIRQQLLDTYVERGRDLLFEHGKAIEGLLWLHRAQQMGSKSTSLTELLKSALQNICTTRRVLRGHQSTLTDATYSPDGRRIVTASMDKTARVWDADSGHLVAELKGHRDIVNSAAYSPDGKRIVTASWDKTVRVWTADSGVLIAELSAHKEQVYSATYSPAGHRILTAGADGTALIWDVDNMHPIGELKGHRGLIGTAIFSPDGSRILTSSWDKAARVWDAASGRLLSEIGGHKARLLSATYSPDGASILIASMDNAARVWDAGSGRLVAELKGPDVRLNSATYSPDGTHILTTHDDNTARIWESENGHLVAELRGHEASVYHARYSPDGHRIVTASVDSTARVWEVGNSRLIAEIKGHKAGVLSATYSPDGQHILTGGGESTNRSVIFLDALVDGSMTGSTGRRNNSKISRYSSDGSRVFYPSLDNIARVWNADSGRLITELKGHNAAVNSVTYSPDGRRILTASGDGTARVWEVDSGRLSIEFKVDETNVHSAVYSPDGRRIVTGGWDGTTRIWAADSGRLVAELKGQSGSVNSVAYSPDGRRIVTGSWDHTARVWEADNGHLVTEFKGHADSVSSVAYSPDGCRIVTGSRDRTARVWAADSGRLITELNGHAAGVNRAMYSPDGLRIVTASDDYTARVWEAHSGYLVAELKGHVASIYSATYSPDGQRIVTASDDSTVRIWDASPETRTREQITQLVRCHIPARFESEGSNVIIFERPSPTECRSEM